MKIWISTMALVFAGQAHADATYQCQTSDQSYQMVVKTKWNRVGQWVDATLTQNQASEAQHFVGLEVYEPKEPGELPSFPSLQPIINNKFQLTVGQPGELILTYKNQNCPRCSDEMGFISIHSASLKTEALNLKMICNAK